MFADKTQCTDVPKITKNYHLKEPFEDEVLDVRWCTVDKLITRDNINI